MKKNLLIFLTLVFFSPFVVNAEELKLEWEKRIDFMQSDDYVEVLKSMDDGTIFITSTSIDIEGISNKGGDDLLIVKYDKDGNMQWQKSWGGNGEERVESIFQTEEDDVIIIGYSSSTNIEGLSNIGEDDVVIIKYDKDGNMQWQKRWGVVNGSTYLIKPLLTEDDGILLLSSFNEEEIIDGLTNKGQIDAVIVKYDKNGNMQWQKSWGGSGDDYFLDIFQTEDGEFLTYGSTKSKDLDGVTVKGVNDMIIVKYNNEGNILWQKTYGGNGAEFVFHSIQSKDRIVIEFISALTDVAGLQDVRMLVIFDKEGNVLWQNSSFHLFFYFDGKFGSMEDGFLISKLENFDGTEIYTLKKCDKNGNKLWEKDFSSDTYFNYFFHENDGGILAYSENILENSENGESKMMLEKYDNEGNVQWKTIWDDFRDFSNEVFLNFFQTGENTIVNGPVFLEDEPDIPYNKIAKFDKNGNLLWQQINQLQFPGMLLRINNNEFYLLFGDMSTDGNVILKIAKYSTMYSFENITSENGVSSIEQHGPKGIIVTTPNDGYEVDKIIIKDKDGNVLDVEVTKQEDGTYSFELYTDVSVEVIYKEKIENPKTGILDVITILFVGLFISLFGFVFVKRYNERLEF